MSVIEFPVGTKFNRRNFDLVVTTHTSGIGLDGKSQDVFTENRYWGGTIGIGSARGALLGQIQAAFDDLKGASGSLRIKLPNPLAIHSAMGNDQFLREIGLSEADIARGYFLWSDGSTWSDGSGWSLPGLTNPSAIESAEIGASRIRVSGAVVALIKVGAVFSGNDFLYRVAAVDGDEIRFNPPLREAVDAGAEVEVLDPKIRVKLTEDSAAQLRIDPGYLLKAKEFSVREDFDR